MKKSLPLLLIGTLFLTTGCFQAQPTEPPNAPAAAAPPDAAQDASTPTLNLEVQVNGHQATILFHTKHFKLSPDHYNKANVPGEGHIHLFIDGSPTKVSVKEPAYTLTDLKPGKHTVRASLHTNSHQPYPHAVDTLVFEIK